jgi:hypothetical protein
VEPADHCCRIEKHGNDAQKGHWHEQALEIRHQLGRKRLDLTWRRLRQAFRMPLNIIDRPAEHIRHHRHDQHDVGDHSQEEDHKGVGPEYPARVASGKDEQISEIVAERCTHGPSFLAGDGT